MAKARFQPYGADTKVTIDVVRPWPRSGQGHSASQESLTAFACRHPSGIAVASPGSGRGPTTKKTHADNRQVLIGYILVPALFYLLF